MPSPGDNYAIHKVSVRRARQACGPCRRKKARCPGEKPTCSLCQRLGQRCSYGSQAASAPGPATGSARRLEEPCDEGQPEGASSQRLQRIERRLDEMAGILQESLSRGRGLPGTDLQSSRGSGRLETDGLTGPFASQSEDRGVQGTFSLVDFVKSQVEVYLLYFHDQPYCVFSKDWLLSRASSLPAEIAFPLVALTSRLSLHPRGIFASNVPTAEYWAEKAWDTLSTQYRDSQMGLSFLQGTCLMAQVDFADGRAHRAYASCALGIRTLQSAGLNRDLFSSSLDGSSLEERRRITWAFFMLDRTYNASRSYSLCLADKQFSLPFPSPDPEESSPGSMHDEPEHGGEMVENSILACLIRLFGLWGKATEYVFEAPDEKAHSPWQSGSAFAVLESEWMQFETQFPNAHRYLNVESELRAGKESRNGAYLPTWLCVQFLLHSIQCLLHHPFVIMIKLRHISGNLSSTFLQKSFESSLLHSRWIARLIKEMSTADSRPYDPFLAYLAAIAATIQLEHTASSNPDVARLVNKEFQVLINFMTKVSTHWANIRVLVDRVSELAHRRRNFGSLYYNQDGFSGALPRMPTPTNIPKMSAEDESLMWDILDISSSSGSGRLAQLSDLVPSPHRQTGVRLEQAPSRVSQEIFDRSNREQSESMQAELSAPEMSLLDGRVLALMAEDPAGWSFPRSNNDEFGNAIPDLPDWMMSSGHMPEHL
ncbi:hypothetical protein P170DRAFT_435157 [Aspergillus steynii IBT 23096]|uniref:Zn(2)-C6 fungal-type domain-containing protein n=1 Tax=Aspergillus steynii IBT 23096 TaxID=1392250 RepID=A0A2I2GL00_9EURO|nr:uncharacterized protein P170DRAFT_435157 [Aspergillus steynii IBT 23096]PLB53556.1 hypothetical protein P170DRAFT_435157 [Aspergillus steynii IBT 23096]